MDIKKKWYIFIENFLNKRGSEGRSIQIFLLVSIVSQAVVFLSSPVLSRLYSPESFGIYGVIMALSGIFAVVITGRYEQAILLPKDILESFHIVLAALMLTVLGSIGVFLLFLLLPRYYLEYWQMEMAVDFILLVPTATFLQAVYQIVYYWLSRQKQYNSMSWMRLIAAFASVLVAVALADGCISSLGLVFSQIFAYSMAIIGICLKNYRESALFVKQFRWNILVSQMRAYINFPRYLIIAHFFEAVSAQLPVIILNAAFGQLVAGYFSLTQRVVAAPVGFIAKTLGDVIREKLSFSYRENSGCEAEYNRFLKMLCCIGVVPAGLLAIGGPFLFSSVFGVQWEIAGQYAQLLALMIFCQIMASPLSVIYFIAEKQKVEFVLQIVRVILCAGALAIGYYIFKSEFIAIGAYGSIMCLIYLFMVFQGYQWCKKQW